MARWTTLAIAFVLMLPVQPLTAGELRITVDGIRSQSGDILIGLDDSAESFSRAIERSDKEGFLNDPARVVGAALRVNVAMRSGVVFTNLEPGHYAIICFHDENGNGRLDKSFWGVPSEPYGFSNDAHGFLGPPEFAAAALTLDGSNKTVTIELTLPAEAQ
jgi:uncharacterized protein (DUF2141 family)